MKGKQFHLLLLTAASAAIILALDVSTPLGFTTFNLYVGVVLLASWLPWPHAALWTAAGCTALIPLGALLSPAGSTEVEIILANRSIAVGAIWLVALLIVKRKRAEAGERLAREARDYAINIVETVREPLVILDADLRVRQANRSFYATFRTTPEATHQRPFLELGKGQWDIPQLRQALESIIPRHSELNDFEAEIEIETLGRRTMILNARKLYRPGNNTEQILVAIEDFTDRKQAEEERDRFFSLSLDMLCIAGKNGYFKRVSPAFTKTLGWSIEEMLARPFLDFVHPDDHAATLREVERQVVAGEQVLDFENRYRHKDGSWRLLSWKSAPQPDGLMYAIARDITERKEAEERFRTLANNISQFAWMADEKGWIFWYNQRWYDYSGTTLEEMQGWGWQKVHHPEHVQRVVDKIRHCFQTGQVWEDTFPLRGKDGNYRWFLSRAVPIRDDQGKVFRWLGTNTDITEQREAEDTLRKSREQLEIANKELEAFSYSVSHDLRAPLRHINGFAELLGKHAATELDDKGRRFLQTISDSAKQMGALVDDLLAFSRVGRTEMRITTVRLDQVVKDVLREIQPDIQNRHITWTVGALPEVHGDPPLLRQVLLNLIGNAVKYTRLRDQATIEVGCLNGSEAEHVVFVRDNGAGFDMQYAHKLFGVFQRLHTAVEFEGTGIGLANVQRIIHRHGGRVWAEGTVNGGATFYVALPARKEASHDG